MDRKYNMLRIYKDIKVDLLTALNLIQEVNLDEKLSLYYLIY